MVTSGNFPHPFTLTKLTSYFMSKTKLTYNEGKLLFSSSLQTAGRRNLWTCCRLVLYEHAEICRLHGEDTEGLLA